MEFSDVVPGIPGRAWKDYPMFSSMPRTSFSCSPEQAYGYYADMDTGCQMWHYCQPDGRHNSFLCANGTVFNQKTRVCDWWYNVHCPSSAKHYANNVDLYISDEEKRVAAASDQPHRTNVEHYLTSSKLHEEGLGERVLEEIEAPKYVAINPEPDSSYFTPE
jgi:hypothetical protein